MPRKSAKRRRSKKAKPKEMPELVPANDEVLPTQERFVHGDVIQRARSSPTMTFGDRPPLRVLTQTKLDRYLHQEVISPGMYDAGMRLYGEWRASGCEPKIVGGYGVRIEGPANLTERQAILRGQVTAALVAVGEVCSRILVHVCLCDGSAKDWALGRGMKENVARTYGIWLLKDALGSLERHYRERERR